jgi:hypothetical protein
MSCVLPRNHLDASCRGLDVLVHFSVRTRTDKPSQSHFFAEVAIELAASRTVALGVVLRENYKHRLCCDRRLKGYNKVHYWANMLG